MKNSQSIKINLKIYRPRKQNYFSHFSCFQGELIIDFFNHLLTLKVVHTTIYIYSNQISLYLFPRSYFFIDFLLFRIFEFSQPNHPIFPLNHSFLN